METALPAYVSLRHDLITGSWVLTCDACGVRERYRQYWTAARVTRAHAAMHQDSDPDPDPAARELQ
jgi:hypothetical protein